MTREADIRILAEKLMGREPVYTNPDCPTTITGWRTPQGKIIPSWDWNPYANPADLEQCFAEFVKRYRVVICRSKQFTDIEVWEWGRAVYDISGGSDYAETLIRAMVETLKKEQHETS